MDAFVGDRDVGAQSSENKRTSEDEFSLFVLLERGVADVPRARSAEGGA